MFSEMLSSAIDAGDFPGILYKYRDLGERTYEILRRKSMWFATPESFNDPFDCNLAESLSYTRNDLEAYLASQDVDQDCIVN
jgi:hypothetical protein